MPYTPYHLGVALFFGMIFFSTLDFPAFLLASIAPDIEPLVITTFNLKMPLHGFLHTFVGSSFLAVGIALIMIFIDQNIRQLLSLLRLKQKYSISRIIFASFAGVWIHIIIDARIYEDMKPFFPYEGNPFYDASPNAVSETIMFCILLFVVGAALYFYKIMKDAT